MKKNIKISFENCASFLKSNQFHIFRSVLVIFSGIYLLSFQQAKSEEIFLECTGTYEINRGPLIKPDWETSYLRINLNGLISTVDDQSGIKKGRTSTSGKSYRITHRDSKNNIENIYKINKTYGTYILEYPKKNRKLIGTCQKSRG
tara:strand:+ start:965 stop:1402 length:438 start_codon:yes stop_codon:yes gene_type:complete